MQNQKNMAYKIFFDVNVLLDYVLQRKNFDEIEQLINNIEGGLQKGFISSATIHTLSYFLTKEYGIKKTKEILLNLLSALNVIDPPQEIIKSPIHANFNDIEDAIQDYTAIYYKFDFFLTSDKKLKKESSSTLPIYTPIEFIKEYIS